MPELGTSSFYSLSCASLSCAFVTWTTSCYLTYALIEILAERSEVGLSKKIGMCGIRSRIWDTRTGFTAAGGRARAERGLSAEHPPLPAPAWRTRARPRHLLRCADRPLRECHVPRFKHRVRACLLACSTMTACYASSFVSVPLCHTFLLFLPISMHVEACENVQPFSCFCSLTFGHVCVCAWANEPTGLCGHEIAVCGVSMSECACASDRTRVRANVRERACAEDCVCFAWAVACEAWTSLRDSGCKGAWWK
eukprot:6186631-Pleurochrysis_carterae.AAC.3